MVVNQGGRGKCYQINQQTFLSLILSAAKDKFHILIIREINFVLSHCIPGFGKSYSYQSQKYRRRYATYNFRSVFKSTKSIGIFQGEDNE